MTMQCSFLKYHTDFWSDVGVKRCSTSLRFCSPPLTIGASWVGFTIYDRIMSSRKLRHSQQSIYTLKSTFLPQECMMCLMYTDLQNLVTHATKKKKYRTSDI